MGWADLRACAHACAARKEFSKKCFHLPQPLCRKGLRQSDVSHCFHNAITPIYRYEYDYPTHGIGCLVCRRVCLKIKRWALFRKRWALFSKRSPFLCTYSCPMFNNSCLVNEIRCEMSVKAMWNAWSPLPPAKHTQTSYIQALSEMRERWKQYFWLAFFVPAIKYKETIIDANDCIDVLKLFNYVERQRSDFLCTFAADNLKTSQHDEETFFAYS